MGLCVAFLVVALVPFRERVIAHVFTEAELRVLDVVGEPTAPDEPGRAMADAEATPAPAHNPSAQRAGGGDSKREQIVAGLKKWREDLRARGV